MRDFVEGVVHDHSAHPHRHRQEPLAYGRAFDRYRPQPRRLALNAVSGGVDAAGVRARLLAQPGVTALHDLHIGSTSTTETPSPAIS